MKNFQLHKSTWIKNSNIVSTMSSPHPLPFLPHQEEYVEFLLKLTTRICLQHHLIGQFQWSLIYITFCGT